MANRVLMGQRGAEYGLWVSKPGQNVLTAGVDNLLFSTDEEVLQVVQSGEIANPGVNATVDVTIPNLGFNPYTLVSCARWRVTLEYVGSTTLRLRTLNRTIDPSVSGVIRYAVLSVPVM